MAIPRSTYQSGLVRDFWTGVRQRRGQGSRLSAQETESLVNSMMATDLERSIQSERLAEDRRRFDIQQSNVQEQMTREKEAARAQGLVNVAGLYGQYKVGMATADALKSAATGTPGAAGAGLATAGAGAGGALTEGGGALLTAPGELTGSLVPGAGSTPLLEAPTAFAVPEIAGGEAAGASLLSTASTVAGPAALAGGLVSQVLLGKESDVVQGLGGAAAGAAVGFAVGGPVGALVGGGIGLVTSFVDDVSVICTELKRQGLLDPKMHRASTIYCLKKLDPEVFRAYREHADHIVPVMRRSRLVTYLTLPFGRAMARECAHRHDPSKWRGSVLGKMIEKYLQLYVKVQDMRGECYATR